MDNKSNIFNQGMPLSPELINQLRASAGIGSISNPTSTPSAANVEQRIASLKGGTYGHPVKSAAQPKPSGPNMGQEVAGMYTQGGKDIQSDIQKYQQEGGIFGSLGTQMKAGVNIAGDFSKAAMAPITVPLAHVVKSVSDAMNATPLVKDGLQALATSWVGDSVQAIQDKVDSLSKEHPEESHIINSVGNIVILASMLGASGGSSIPKEVKSTVDNHVTQAKGWVGDIAESGQDPQAFLQNQLKNVADQLDHGGFKEAGQAIRSIDPASITDVKSFETQVNGAVQGVYGAKNIAGAPLPLKETAGKATSELGGALKEGTNAIKGLAEKPLKVLQDKAVDTLESDYEKWTGATKAGVKALGKAEAKTGALNESGTTGKLPQRVLAESRIIPETEGTKFRTKAQADAFRESLQPLYDANDKALLEVSRATEPIKIAQLESQSVGQINDLRIPEGDRQALITEVKGEYGLLKQKYGDSISIRDLNAEKQNYWRGTKFDSTRPFKSQGYYQVGSSMQKAIVDTAESAGFKDAAQLNREIGDRLEAAKMLQSLDGQTIKGGRLGKYVFMGIGAATGHTIPGKIIGALGGEAVGQLLIDASVSNPVKRMILNSIEEKNPAITNEVEAWLNEQGILRETRPQLPPPSGAQTNVNQGRPIPVLPTDLNGEYVGSETVAQSRPMNLSTDQAMNNANTVANTTPKTITEVGKSKAPPKGEGAIPETTFKGYTDLSTKILEKLKGRSTVSKQFISDLTNSADVRQPERDLIRSLLADEGNTVNVTDFANKVKTELLPLKTNSIYGKGGAAEYENVVLPDNLRGSISDYTEHIYESPIKTTAGDIHFRSEDVPNYFAHTRIEDLPPNSYKKGEYAPAPSEKGTTRRVIELQSDLFQKGRLENEGPRIAQQANGKWGAFDQKNSNPIGPQFNTEAEAKAFAMKDVAKLEPYRNTWHERVIREEVKQAAKDGKTKLQFPTGETAMKIEGLGENTSWALKREGMAGKILEPEDLKVGQTVTNSADNLDYEQEWIITDVLGDGKFKAVPKDEIEYLQKDKPMGLGQKKWSANNLPEHLRHLEETFDISGKVDTNNPIYRFYNKEVGSFLIKQYGAKVIKDPQGVDWFEVDIRPAMKNEPIKAFGMGKDNKSTA